MKIYKIFLLYKYFFLQILIIKIINYIFIDKKVPFFGKKRQNRKKLIFLIPINNEYYTRFCEYTGCV